MPCQGNNAGFGVPPSSSCSWPRPRPPRRRPFRAGDMNVLLITDRYPPVRPGGHPVRPLRQDTPSRRPGPPVGRVHPRLCPDAPDAALPHQHHDGDDTPLSRGQRQPGLQAGGAVTRPWPRSSRPTATGPALSSAPSSSTPGSASTRASTSTTTTRGAPSSRTSTSSNGRPTRSSSRPWTGLRPSPGSGSAGSTSSTRTIPTRRRSPSGRSTRTIRIRARSPSSTPSSGASSTRSRRRGALAKTIVIVTSDHGEAFGEKEEFRHGFFAYDNTLHVPLIIYVPGGRARDGRPRTPPRRHLPDRLRPPRPPRPGLRSRANRSCPSSPVIRGGNP